MRGLKRHDYTHDFSHSFKMKAENAQQNSFWLIHVAMATYIYKDSLLFICKVEKDSFVIPQAKTPQVFEFAR